MAAACEGRRNTWGETLLIDQLLQVLCVWTLLRPLSSHFLFRPSDSHSQGGWTTTPRHLSINNKVLISFFVSRWCVVTKWFGAIHKNMDCNRIGRKAASSWQPSSRGRWKRSAPWLLISTITEPFLSKPWNLNHDIHYSQKNHWSHDGSNITLSAGENSGGAKRRCCGRGLTGAQISKKRPNFDRGTWFVTSAAVFINTSLVLAVPLSWFCGHNIMHRVKD